jgi:hypothetical protein
MCFFLSGRSMRLHVLFSWNRIHLLGHGAIPPFWVDAFAYSYATLINVWQHEGEKIIWKFTWIGGCQCFLVIGHPIWGHCCLVNCFLRMMVVQWKTFSMSNHNKCWWWMNKLLNGVSTFEPWDIRCGEWFPISKVFEWYSFH